MHIRRTFHSLHYCKSYRYVVFFILFLLIASATAPLLPSQLTKKNHEEYPSILTGQILFAPMSSKITYLIDTTGAVTHTWVSDYIPGEAVRWLGDGTILRTIKTVSGGVGGGSGGGVQKICWDGTIEWEYQYNTNGYLTHHDVLSLPNGNVLMIAWETKTRDEAIAAGRNPTYVGDLGFMPDHLIEVQPTGPTSGTIVWEWHVWDHLIQDFDASKANFGDVENHPELVDINYAFDVLSHFDWLHSNSIDYNPEFDQILISVHNFNEVWIIDHSTTTQEAAGHTGGNSGKGGDLLYRWGNPEAYKAGTPEDKKFFGQHDATWIKPGCPGEGNILVFNNGGGRPEGRYSSVDEIVPPVDENGVYYLKPGEAYGPTSQTWIYTADPPTSLYCGIVSGAERLMTGNTLICAGTGGRFFEVTPEGSTVWEYVNPYPTPSWNTVFKIVYIPPEVPPEPNVPNLECSGSLSWANVAPGATVTGSFLVRNIGDADSFLNWTINTSSIPWGTWSYTPESGRNLTPADEPISVQVSVKAPETPETDFEGYIQVVNQQDPSDFCVIPVSLATPTVKKHADWLSMEGFLHWIFSHSFIIHLPFLLKLFKVLSLEPD